MRKRQNARFSFLLVVGLALATHACQSAPEVPDEPAVFYPLPPDPPRIQFLRTVSRGSDIEDGQSSLDTLLFGEPQHEKSVLAPYGVAVHDGKVYVCDIQQSTVLILDFQGKNLGYIDMTGRGDLQKPCGLDFAEDGKMYVADLGRRQVVAYDADFNYEAEYGPFGDDSKPVGVAVRGDRVYIVDSGSKLVRIIDRNSGEEIGTFGKSEEIGQSLRSPTNITIDEAGSVYVVDTMDCQVFVYDQDGEFQRHVGGAGDTIGRFARPKGIAHSQELLFVVDAAFENCQIFDPEGTPLMFFGGSGVGPGDLYLPAGLWVGSEGLDLFRDDIADGFEAEQLIIVTNLYGPRKVNFYAFGRDKRFDYTIKPQEPAVESKEVVEESE